MNSLPGMQGNPHADALKLHQDFGNTLSPTVQATLALAYEQRTTNLIAQLDLRIRGIGKGVELQVEVFDELNDRLGLGGDDS